MSIERKIAASEIFPADQSDTTKSSIRVALAILLFSLVLGAGFRFYRLGADEMNRGEAAAWEAASAPTIRDVIESGRRIDPGKLALYDITLHCWMTMFGDHVGALRRLSAITGVFSILFVFLSVREILRFLAESPSVDFAELAGAFAALLLACNLQMITLDRTARMYSPMLAAMLIQLFFFVRSFVRPGALNWLVAAIFTALAIAFNYTSGFFFAAEGLWLVYLLIARRRSQTSTPLTITRPVLALTAAAAIIVPLAALSSRIEVRAMHVGALEWIERQPPWWPIRALKVVAGNAAFWPMLALSIFGLWYQRTRSAHAIGLIVCWLTVPFAIDMLISYAITPFMIERYVLASLVAFLVLTAIGLASIQSGMLRYAIAILVVVQSLDHIHHHWRAPEDIQWREAAQLAAATVPRGKQIALMPPGEPLLVMHYYLPAKQRDLVVNSDAAFDGATRSWSFRCGAEPIAIVQLELQSDFLRSIHQCYPHVLKKFRQVEVLAR